ncbi:MAG: hypothetical protein K8R59_00350 [Thermoanaerobaculales bacterium]|nr:hypothetical protein [Thermoanaerobaculales bacterium]
MTDDAGWFSDESLNRERWRALVESPLERVGEALIRGRFPHALLLSGPEGLGRELMAVETAIMMVCEEHSKPWADSVLAQRVRAGTHPDVVALRGEGRKNIIKIDTIRQVAQQAPGRPFEGRFRVWILDGVDSARLPTPAANAFLKLLEEPPPHVRFLLLAANPQSALPTIRSRCAHLVLPGTVAAAKYLEDNEAPPEVAHRTEGGAPVSELVGSARAGILKVLDGNVPAAIHLATVFGEAEHGLELVAAAAIGLAGEAGGDDRADACASLAAELMASDGPTRALGLRPSRQILSILLRWTSGEARR